ncbi:MAG: AmmeMemoRadiSam system protein B [Candidatus Thiodiazotropha sp. 6PLUC2]
MTSIRQPAVSDIFYPGDPQGLRKMVSDYLDHVVPHGVPPKALIAPHAGYIYSGAVAATVYARLKSVTEKIQRVVLLGPSHRVPFLGLAVSGADYFRTPLGDIALDREAIAQLVDMPQVAYLDQAHTNEHSLEVQLPFLQQVLESFSLIPIVVGDVSGEVVSEVLGKLWGGDETLIVISSDLSHYHDYVTAQRMDQQTSESILSLDPDSIRYEDACGRIPIQGLLLQAKKLGLQGEIIDLRNSGDTAGDKNRVVGYGAYAFNRS